DVAMKNSLTMRIIQGVSHLSSDRRGAAKIFASAALIGHFAKKMFQRRREGRRFDGGLLWHAGRRAGSMCSIVCCVERRPVTRYTVGGLNMKMIEFVNLGGVTTRRGGNLTSTPQFLHHRVQSLAMYVLH